MDEIKTTWPKAAVSLMVTVFLWGPHVALGLRIVTTSPQVSELLFQLGRGEDIVAASEGSEVPGLIPALPVIGPLFMPSVELTVFLRPDWVILDQSNLNLHYERSVQFLGFRTHKLDIKGVQSLFSEAENLLHTLYGETKNSFIEKTRQCVANFKSERTFRFLAFVWASPSIVFGSSTFLSDLLTRVGGINVVPESWKMGFPSISEEWIVSNPVDVLFFLDDIPGSDDLLENLAKKWWPGHSIRIEPLASRYFARSSFSPLFHIEDFSFLKPAVQIGNCVGKTL